MGPPPNEHPRELIDQIIVSGNTDVAGIRCYFLNPSTSGQRLLKEKKNCRSTLFLILLIYESNFESMSTRAFVGIFFEGN